MACNPACDPNCCCSSNDIILAGDKMRVFIADSIGHGCVTIKSRNRRISTVRQHSKFSREVEAKKYFLYGDIMLPESAFPRFTKRGMQLGVWVRIRLFDEEAKSIFVFSPGLSEILKSFVAENLYADVYADYAAWRSYNLENVRRWQ